MEGLQLFDNMLMARVNPTNFTYTTLLSVCSRLRDGLAGEATHVKVIVSGIAPDLPLYSTLLDMYSSCGDSEAALKVFGKIKKPDLVSWNSMISGYANNGDGEMAEDSSMTDSFFVEVPDEVLLPAKNLFNSGVHVFTRKREKEKGDTNSEVTTKHDTNTRQAATSQKISLPFAFKNDEYEVRETAGTMDPLTPNRVAFPGLTGISCKS
uniref:Pentatricopeptide repeat-containing protein At5g27110-like n=1 Tax=Nicotiana tabacum TaxID=4097 RepID=A0A1S4CUW3_TOBAC|nr:PREDICTED: pentatricopeptide repeat-containing protein At5g27110-like [Nicotiana tabacum]